MPRRDRFLVIGGLVGLMIAWAPAARADLVFQVVTIAGRKDRVFHIFPGVTVDLEGVTISGGSTLTKETVADPTTVEGGGILNLGILQLSYCNVTGNKAQTDGGGIANTLLDTNKPFNRAGTIASGGGNVESTRPAGSAAATSRMPASCR